MARTRASDFEEKQHGLLVSAAAVFAEQGMEKASMAQIASHSGVSKALLYHYYPSKDVLIFAIIHTHLVDLEALAHAARETLDRLPYMPRPSGSEGQELEVRLNYGRLQTLVAATATSAKEVLLACDQMLAESEEPPDDDGEGEGGPDEPSGSSGNGEPGVSGPGHLLQAQADGAFAASQLQGTLAQLCCGERPARRDAREITLFKSVGSALQDLAAAQLVWQGVRD